MTLRTSSSSSLANGWTYDVFLNFRGEDTRISFIGNLYNALCEKGINTFIDDEGLRKGEELRSAIFQAIKESRIAITVFSENYASSNFCLDELVEILEWIHGNGRLVCPVFYKVDPSVVRHQRGSYGEAMAKHEKKFKNDKKLQKWRLALHEAASLSGLHFKYGYDPTTLSPVFIEYEYKFIQRIVEEISKRLSRSPLHVASYPVGLECHVWEVNSLLDVRSQGVKVLGIYGIGGIGKTTIACAVYNFIANQFEGVCFLADIRENSLKNGLVQLQETMLCEILGEKDIKLRNVNKGISIIKSRLDRKKVLLILDDVDKLEQLQAIAGGLDWFGSGSRIIITTRDKHLLDVYGVERNYEVNGLDRSEALQLFCWNAFKNNKTDESYKDITFRIVEYCVGLPLALVIIGSNLCGKTLDEWESALDTYAAIPNKNVQEILRVSYDGLEEKEKEIFLDMTCFFGGYSLKDATHKLLNGRGSHAKYCIGVLIDKSLLKIDENGFVRMHDLIKDMGREIVRQESPSDPGKRSRLWFYKDILHVLEDNTGTRKIEMIMLHLPKDKEVQWSKEAFKKMKNLKVLIIKGARFSREPKHLPKNLRVLDWEGYSSPSLPSIYPRELVILKLQKSCLTLDKPLKNFESLTELDLSFCEFLEQVPDISGAPNLTNLCLDYCSNLIQVHDSVGFLNKLKWLNANGCHKLRSLPSGIKFTSLESLSLTGCSSLQSFPEILGMMENIKEVDLDGTSIKELPFSIQNLIGLETLWLTGCKRLNQLPSSITTLPKLEKLIGGYWKGVQYLSKSNQERERVSLMLPSNVRTISLWSCNLTNEFFLAFLPRFLNIEELILHASKFTILPECIKECHLLKDLNLDNCKQLQEIRALPPNIKKISAVNCTSLTTQSTSLLLNQALHEAGGTYFIVPGSRIPEWFDLGGGDRKLESCSFWFRRRLPSLALCVVGRPYGGLFWSKPSGLVQVDVSFAGRYTFGTISTLETDHIFLSDLKNCYDFAKNVIKRPYVDREWNCFYTSLVHPYYRSQVLSGKCMGLHLFKDNASMQDIRFAEPLLENRVKRRRLFYKG